MNYSPDILNEKGFIKPKGIPVMQYSEDFFCAAQKIKGGGTS